jgi:hypothetical protein
MYQAKPLLMEWCLSCHRSPENFIRPRAEVFNMNYRLPEGRSQRDLGLELKKEYNIAGIEHLTSCSVCHR